MKELLVYEVEFNICNKTPYITTYNKGKKMGYAGQPMKVIKANRALLKKNKSFKDLRKDYINHSQTTKLQFKELSEVERKKVRAKIIAQVKKDRIEEIGLYLISISLAIGILYVLYYFLL